MTAIKSREPAGPKPRDGLRIVVGGEEGAGKTALIGRLVASGSVPKDQPGRGIPVDIWRHFAAGRRAFAAADIADDAQHARHMVSAASSADVAILLVDARSGITDRIMHDSRIATLLGIREIALVINKMDLVDYSEQAFDAIVESYREFAASLDTLKVTPIPVAAASGENIAAHSDKMHWFKGPSVLEYLETVEVSTAAQDQPFRFPVQSIVTDLDSRGFTGTLASGSVSRGDNASVARLRLASRIERIVSAEGGDLERATAGDMVTLVFADHLDASPGDVIADPAHAPDVTDQFAAHIVWFEEAPLFPGRSYSLHVGTRTVVATVTSLRHKLELQSGAEEAGHNLARNEIGFCHLATLEPIALDACRDNRITGSFILADRLTGATVGAGMVAFALRRASNIRHQHYEVNKQARSAMKSQCPCIIWFTGLPSAGKSTVMNLVEQRLHRQGVHTYSLDGDNLRGGLTRDLGFTDADRVENIRRAGEVAKLMVDAGLVVLCAFVSPFRAERRMVRELVGEGEFVEVFVDTPLETCIARDPKGLYRKAREGKVFHVTGIDSPYEAPEHAEIHLQPAVGKDADAQADAVLSELIRRGITA